MAARKRSSDFGLLQEFVDAMYREAEFRARLELILEAESYGLNEELLEVVNLLPPGSYTRDRLCTQLNSSLSSHGWGYVYGAVH